MNWGRRGGSPMTLSSCIRDALLSINRPRASSLGRAARRRRSSWPEASSYEGVDLAYDPTFGEQEKRDEVLSRRFRLARPFGRHAAGGREFHHRAVHDLDAE